MDHAAALAELLARHGFHRHGLIRSRVGHLHLLGHLADEPVTLLIDTGAASTVIDLGYCRERRLPLGETDRLGGGAGGVTLAIHTLSDVQLMLDGRPVWPDALYALDLSHVNDGLTRSGADPVQGVLGADVLRFHRAVIDCAALSVFLHHDPP